MTADRLKWFIQYTAGFENSLRREEYVKLFLSGDRAGIERVSELFSGNNSKLLYSPAKRTGSVWRDVTLPAARRIAESAARVAADLSDNCGEGYFEAAQNIKEEYERLYPAAVKDSLYTQSRLCRWLEVAERSRDRDKTATALACIFAELVFMYEEGAPRLDKGDIILELMQGVKSGGDGNIYMTGRRRLEAQDDIEERLAGVRCVRLLNIAATSFVYDKVVSSDPHQKSRKSIFERAIKNHAVFQVILPEPGSIGELDAGATKAVEAYPGRTGADIIKQMRELLMAEIEKMGPREGGVRPIQLCFTPCAIPHALLIATFDEPERDFVKVDLYSPYLNRDSDRRSFYVFRGKDPENFEFFFNNFTEIWNRGTKI